MTNVDSVLLRWTSILMLAGGILFWIGAFTPPYKQWATSDLKEYLAIISCNRINWFLIHTPMVLGVIVTMFSLQVFSNAAAFTSNGKIFSILSSSAFSFGAVLLIISFAFRLTVTLWVAGRFTETGNIETWYDTWMNWSNLIFSIYMVIAYLSIGFWGLALMDVPIAPPWTIWFCILFGFLGAIGYISRFLLFEPPLIIHLPFLVVSITMLLKLR
jgi:hypothetical protein